MRRQLIISDGILTTDPAPAAVSALRSILIGRQDIAVYFPPPRLARKLLLIPLLATLVSLLNTITRTEDLD